MCSDVVKLCEIYVCLPRCLERRTIVCSRLSLAGKAVSVDGDDKNVLFWMMERSEDVFQREEGDAEWVVEVLDDFQRLKNSWPEP